MNEVDNTVVQNDIITAAVRGVQYNGQVVGGNTGGLVQRNLISSLTADPNGSYGVLAFNASYASVVDNTMAGLDIGIFEQYFYYANGGLNPNNVISGNVITAAQLGYGTNQRPAPLPPRPPSRTTSTTLVRAAWASSSTTSISRAASR